MTRQSISLTEPNDNWLRSVVDSKEYTSKSELINDLIRQARHQQVRINWIKAKLEKTEESAVDEKFQEKILNYTMSFFK